MLKAETSMHVIGRVVQEQRTLRGLLLSTIRVSGFSGESFNLVSCFCSLISSETCAAPAVNSSESGIETDVREEGKSLSWRIEKLPRGELVACAFRSWMGDGFPVQRNDIFHAINRLRRLKSNKRALQVMEWVIREKPYMLQELDYSYLLEFTMKLHGVEHGEKLFSRIPVEFKKERLYNNLVIGCLENHLIRLALEYMKKMRELGHQISYLVFNRLIILHSSPSRKKVIPKVLTQMKADKVAPHVSTYNILLKIEADEHDVDGLIKVFGDMKHKKIQPNEITYCVLAMAHAVARLYTACGAYAESIEKSMTGLNWSTLDILLILYGSMRKQKELERTWRTIQQLPHIRVKSFVLAVEAFGKLGYVERAEELWIQMKSEKGLKSVDEFNSMISVYCSSGLIAKATALYKDMEKNGCKPNAITLRHLALGCLKAGLVKEGVKTMDLSLDFSATPKITKSTPWLELTLSIIEIFAERGDVENVEKLFEELKRSNYTRYAFVYNVLIKAYVKGKVYKPNLLRRMILGGCRPDPETYSLVKLIEQFRPE